MSHSPTSALRTDFSPQASRVVVSPRRGPSPRPDASWRSHRRRGNVHVVGSLIVGGMASSCRRYSMGSRRPRGITDHGSALAGALAARRSTPDRLRLRARHLAELCDGGAPARSRRPRLADGLGCRLVCAHACGVAPTPAPRRPHHRHARRRTGRASCRPSSLLELSAFV